MGDDRPACYYEDDVLIIRASAIGSSCLWELVAAGQGYEPGPVPPNLQRAFDHGNQLEPVIVSMLEDEGYTIIGSQDEGHLDILPNLRIRFHPDGMTLRGENLIGVEIKALSDVLWQKAARHSVGACIDEYNWQISVMMHAHEMPFMWVAYNKGNADRSLCQDEGRLLYEPIVRPPISLEEITNKAIKVKALIEDEDILTSGRACDDPKKFPCRYLHLRPESNSSWINNRQDDKMGKDDMEQIDATLALTGDDAEELDRLVRVYRSSKGVAEEAKEAADKARDRIIELSRKHKRVMTEKFVVPVVRGKNTSPDWASMPAELKEQVNQYKKETPYFYIKGIQALGDE